MSLEDELYQQRIDRIRKIEALGFKPYGHRFDFSHSIPQILAGYGEKTAADLESRVQVRIAGRIATIRRMGKAGFAHLLQNGDRLQIYVRKDAVGENDFARSGYSFWPRPCFRCPRNGTAWKTLRSAIGSAI